MHQRQSDHTALISRSPGGRIMPGGGMPMPISGGPPMDGSPPIIPGGGPPIMPSGGMPGRAGGGRMTGAADTCVPADKMRDEHAYETCRQPCSSGDKLTRLTQHLVLQGLLAW